MAWSWRVDREDGADVALGIDVPELGTQGDAESWLGENWRDLRESGADQVTLLEDGRVVYGPMSLLSDS